MLISSVLYGQIDKVKSAFIYQFTKYINWCPENQTGDFVIGVLGNSPIIDELNNLGSQKKVANHDVLVKKFIDVDDVTQCNILFVSEDKNSLFGSVNSMLSSVCTVIICEKKGMAKKGAAINLIQNNGKILFELNEQAFSSRSLTIDHKLLKLAKASY